MYILYEAIHHFREPQSVQSTGMLIVVIIGLIVNLVSTRLIPRARTPASTSRARIWMLQERTIHVTLDGGPGGLKLPGNRSAIAAGQDVASVHDLHVWSMVPTKSTAPRT